MEVGKKKYRIEITKFEGYQSTETEWQQTSDTGNEEGEESRLRLCATAIGEDQRNPGAPIGAGGA